MTTPAGKDATQRFCTRCGRPLKPDYVGQVCLICTADLPPITNLAAPAVSPTAGRPPGSPPAASARPFGSGSSEARTLSAPPSSIVPTAAAPPSSAVPAAADPAYMRAAVLKAELAQAEARRVPLAQPMPSSSGYPWGQRFIASLRGAALFTLIVNIILLCIGMFILIYGGFASSQWFGQNTPAALGGAMLVLFAGGVGLYLIWLNYAFMMALPDYLECLLQIEHNTRPSR